MNIPDRIAEMIDFGPEVGQSDSMPVEISDIPTQDIRMGQKSSTCLRNCNARSCVNWDNGMCTLETVVIDDCGCCAMFCQDGAKEVSNHQLSSGSNDLMDFISDLINP